MVDRSLYKVGVVVSVDDVGSCKTKGKALRSCKVNIGDEENPITVVTSATNVREGSRLVVAPAGAMVMDGSGDEVEVKKASVGGVMSEGIFCDSTMLGWTGGAAGIAAQVPDSCVIGSPPPASKPGRPTEEAAPAAAAAAAPGLFEKKLTKEEKKKLAEERKKARKAAKEAKAAKGAAEAEGGEEEEEEDDS